MEKTYSIEIKVSEEQIIDLLANGLAGVCGFDNIDYDSRDYQEAKTSLIAEGKTDLCREDIWARMLFLNKSLKLHDSEEDEDEGWHDLKLENILKQNVDWKKLEDGDFFDNDAILQIACYGEVIYG